MQTPCQQRLSRMLEDQFMACDQMLHDAIARAADQTTEIYSPEMVRIAATLARVTVQMAATLSRLENGARTPENRGSNP